MKYIKNIINHPNVVHEKHKSHFQIYQNIIFLWLLQQQETMDAMENVINSYVLCICFV